MLARRASYDKKTLARQVIPLAPGYRQHFHRALLIVSFLLSTLSLSILSKGIPVAQLVEHWAVMREVAGSNPSRMNTQDLKIAEEKVLPL